MAEVWAGRHAELDVPVAIKVIKGPKAVDPQFLRLFAAEVRTIAALDHPGIVWVHDHGRIPAALDRMSTGRLVAGSPYLVMELADGPSLTHARPKSWPELRDLLLQLLSALAHCHARGVVHRDLKTGNVLRFGTPEKPRWKLTDFGIAWIGAENTATHLDRAVGSPSTMAPEQATAAWRDLGPWTDLYALGCLAWRLAAGHAPFIGGKPADVLRAQVYDSPPPFRPEFEVPDGFAMWLHRLLAKRPEDRPQSAAAAALALCELDGTEPSNVEIALEPRARTASLVGAGLGLFGLRPAPLVGRATQRSHLLQALRLVETGTGGRLVLLRGEAGIGKSRLAKWLAEEAAEAGRVDVVEISHGAVIGQADGIAGAIARHARCLDLPGKKVRKRLERLLSDVLDQSPREALALTELISPATTEDRAARPGLIALRSTAARHTGARRYLEVRAARRTVLLQVEDLHRLADTASFLQTLIEWQDTHPFRILVVATVRDDEPTRAETLAFLDALEHSPRASTLWLEPFDLEDTRQLAAKMVGLDPVLADRVARRAEGNPLFATQLVGDWVKRGVLTPTVSGWRLAPGERAPIPDDLSTLWTERLDAVLANTASPDLRSVELAAMLGQEFTETDWAHACEAFGVPARHEPLSALADASLLTRTEAGWRFAHGLLVEAIQARSRAAGLAARLNASCALALRKPRSRDRTRRYRIACHLIGAGLHRDAIKQLEELVQEQENRMDPEDLAALLDAYERAVEAQGPIGGEDFALWATCALWIHRSRLAMIRARLPEARSTVASALDLARSGRWPDLELRALVRANAVALLSGDLDGAHSFAEQAMRLARHLGNQWTVARLKHRQAMEATRRRHDEHAVVLYREALAMYRELEDAFLAAYVLVGLGSSLLDLGMLEEAEETLEEALLSNRRLGQTVRVGDTRVQLGELARRRRDLQAAQGHYEDAVRIYREAGHYIGLPAALANLAIVALHHHEDLDATRYLDEASRILATAGGSGMAPGILALRLLVHARTASWDAIDDRWEDIDEPIRRGAGVDRDIAWALDELAALADAAGHPGIAARSDTLAGIVRRKLGEEAKTIT